MAPCTKYWFYATLTFFLLLTSNVIAQDEIPDKELKKCFSTNKSAYFNCLDSLKKVYSSASAEMQIVYTKGRYFLRIGQPDSVAYYASLGIEQAKADSNKENEIAFISMLAVAYRHKGNYEKAINNYMQIIKISEQMGNEVNAAVVKVNVANIYIQLSDFESADTILKNAYRTFKKYNNSNHVATTLGMMAFVQLNFGDTTTAISTSTKALALSNKLKNKDGIAKAAGILGSIYQHKQLYDSSIYYFKQTIEVANTISDRYYLTMAKTGLMEAYFKNRQYAEARQIAEELLSSISRSSRAPERIKFYLTYSNILNHFGRHKDAYQYLYKAYELNKEITKSENKKIVNEIRTKYETEKKDKEIAQNKLIMQEQSNLLYKRNLYLTLLVFAVALLILIIILVRMRSKHKLEQLYEQKRLQILNASVEGEEKERKRIARELHDSIANELAVIKMGIESIETEDNESKEKLSSLAAMANAAYKETRRISHNLHPAPSIRNRFAEAVKEYLEGMPAGKAHTEVHVLKKGELKLPAEKQLLIFRIMQELVGNALRHSDAMSITVDLIINEEQVNITVNDDGKGMTEAILHNPETLSSVKENINILDGLIDIDSTVNEGTTIMVSVPNK